MGSKHHRFFPTSIGFKTHHDLQAGCRARQRTCKKFVGHMLFFLYNKVFCVLWWKMIFDRKYIFSTSVKYKILPQMSLFFSLINSCVSSKLVAFLTTATTKWQWVSLHALKFGFDFDLGLSFQSTSISVSISVFKFDLNINLDYSFQSTSISVFSFNFSFDFSFCSRSQFQLPTSTLLEVFIFKRKKGRKMIFTIHILLRYSISSLEFEMINNAQYFLFSKWNCFF